MNVLRNDQKVGLQDGFEEPTKISNSVLISQ